ncbi:hypothetical protein [Rhodohalobacter halophilus]|uniref:hypothetical protein n=1 Tax=Rhodohalobacter halophilus TaxID=1812810 RepID=UPI00083FBB07|nr:hypothetical protein [Rhodohalobacter halophilus]
MAYRNTQIGYFTIIVMGGVSMFLIFMIQSSKVLPSERPILYVSLLLILFLFIIFSTLTVEVNRNELIWYFGPGIWKYRIPIDQIKDVSKVKTHPLEGIGIRWTPGKGWLYNVSGLKAVNILLKNGKSTRIGTDEPEVLISAILEEQKYL